MSNMHPTLELALSELKKTTSMIVKTVKSNSDRKFPKKVLEDVINATYDFIYKNAIKSFISTFTYEENIKNFQKEAEPILNQIIEKWEKITRDSKIDQEIYRMFIEELIENSKISPTIFSDCSAYDVFLSNIWISFEQFELSAKNELNMLYNILLDSSDIYCMNIDTDFMLLDPFQFEVFIANLFEKKGYTCIVTSKTGDYGIDVIAKKDNEIIGIQAKKYSIENKVTNIDVQKLIGALSFKNYKATKGILITTSLFTKMAYEQAVSNPIELWDINRLKKEIEDIIVR